MGLLQNIQDATYNQQAHLSDILRQCKVLAYRLEYDPLKIWVTHELNGYPNIGALPDYRIIKDVQIYGSYIGNHFGGSIVAENSAISTYELPEDIRERITTVYFTQNVAGLENIVTTANKSSIRVSLAADIAHLFHDASTGMFCRKAYHFIGTHAIAGILDTIKTRILEFSLEIEEIYPHLEDTNVGNASVQEKTINKIFNNCILHTNENNTYLYSNKIETLHNNYNKISQNVNNSQISGGLQANQGDNDTQSIE